MPENEMKRFYKTASATAFDAVWTVALDDRPIKTPARETLRVPNQALAEAIAAEWNRQEETVHIPSLHLTRLVNVAIDRTPSQRAGMVDEVVKYCGTDLLCYLAEMPRDLRARQVETWQPIREWAGKALDVLLLEVPDGLLAAPQPPASLEAASQYASGLDDFRLTGLNFGLGLFGSALLAMAACEGEISASQAYEASILDELFQAERWGKDEENEARLTANREQAEALSVVFSSFL